MKTPTRLMHEVFTTYVAEVMGIMNSRSLTQFHQMWACPKCSHQQCSKLRRPVFLQLLQEILSYITYTKINGIKSRCWQINSGSNGSRSTCLPCNQGNGDVVLLKDGQAKCSEWPIGLITKTVASSEGKIHKVMVKSAKQGVVLWQGVFSAV